MTERVTINSQGVITIPVVLREAFGLKANDELILETVDQGLLLRPSMSIPIEFYSEDRIAEFTDDEQALGEQLSEGP